MNARALLVLAVAWLASAPPEVAARTPPVDEAAIQRYVEQEMRADRVPGLALAIVSRDGVLFARGFGHTGRGAPVSPETPFLLGSMSKSFTAVAVMQLVEAGRVELDRPVVHYLPDFAVASPEGPRITVRHLLAHTSGLPPLAPRASAGGSTLADHVAALRGARLVHAPGTEHAYSSPNYQVLGRLVEVVSGEPFGAYMARHLFQPLGMTHSAADLATAERLGLGPGHQLMFGMALPRTLRFEDDRLPTASLVSTAGDLGRFLQAELRGGELDGTRVLSAEALAETHRPQVRTEGFAYAMGWRVSPIAGTPAVHHGGILPNYRGKLVMLPEQGLGVVVLTNVASVLGDPTSHRVADGVAALLVGREPRPTRWSLGTLSLALTLGMLVLLAWQMRGLLRVRRAPRSVPRGVLDLAFATGVLLGVPWAVGFGWGEILRQAPDVGAWLLVMTALGALTGVVRFRRASVPDV